MAVQRYIIFEVLYNNPHKIHDIEGNVPLNPRHGLVCPLVGRFHM